MKTGWRRWWWVPVIALLCFPASFVVTVLLSPLWSWIEATFGIESIGHSGPAEWCFWTVDAGLTLLCWVAAGLALRRLARHPPPDAGPGQ